MRFQNGEPIIGLLLLSRGASKAPSPLLVPHQINHLSVGIDLGDKKAIPCLTGGERVDISLPIDSWEKEV